jgi:hypothetical protein
MTEAALANPAPASNEGIRVPSPGAARPLSCRFCVPRRTVDRGKRRRPTRSPASPAAPPPPKPSPIKARLSGELNLIARLASTKIMPADTSPSPPFRGEREGPNRRVGRVEVGGATYRLVGPLTLPSPPASGGRGVKGRVVRATLRRQIFEQPVVTLSPDSLASRGRVFVDNLRSNNS